MRRRRRPSAVSRPRAPGAPADAYSQQVKPSAGAWNWQPGEVAYGPTPRLGSGVLARITALYGRSKPDGEAE